MKQLSPMLWFIFSFALSRLPDRVRRGVKAALEMPVFLHIINSGAGRTVVFPAGEFVSSSLELRDDTVYRLEKGCVLRAAELTSFAPIGYKRDPSVGRVPVGKRRLYRDSGGSARKPDQRHNDLKRPQKRPAPEYQKQIYQ